MKALLTGANGFLGKHLINKLSSEGCEIFSLGRVEVENTNFFHLESVEDKKTIDRCISDIKPDYLFHLAGTVSNDEAESKKVNTNFAQKLLHAIDKCSLVNKTKVLMVGSASEYGDINCEDMPIKESFEPKPFNTYGKTKLEQTRIGLDWKSNERFIVLARPFNIIGPGMPKFLAIGNFINQINSIENEGEIFAGNLNSQRDYIDVDDVCSIFWELINCNEANGEIINICSGKTKKIKEILDFLIAHSKKNIRIKIDKRLIRKKDIPVFIGDNAKLMGLLKDFEFIPWSSSLKKLIEINSKKI